MDCLGFTRGKYSILFIGCTSENTGQQFISKGYENIAIITNPSQEILHRNWNESRAIVKRSRIMALILTNILSKQWKREKSKQHWTRCFLLPTKPKYHDRILVAISEHFIKLNIKIPSNVALISYDEVTFVQSSLPHYNFRSTNTSDCARFNNFCM